MKTEPSTFSMGDFLKSPGQRTFWDGVRNYQARNFMRDDMKTGDRVVIYHSNASPPGVAGFATVLEGPQPDHTAWDPQSPYYDPKTSPERPVWCGVTLGNPVQAPQFISLPMMKSDGRLTGMLVLRKGQRLSVMPLTEKEYSTLWELSGLPS